MLEHIPKRRSIERHQVRIDQQHALLEPCDAGRVDIVTIGRAPTVLPQFDERTRADTDIDQGSPIVLLDEVEPRQHEGAAEFAAAIAIEGVEIVLIVGRMPGLDRVVADAEFRPPGQAAARKLCRQRENCPSGSRIRLSQLCNIFVHRQNFSGTAKPMRLRSSRGSVIFSGALWPPCPPSTTKVLTLSARPAGTIQPTPPTTMSASRMSASSSRTASSPPIRCQC